MEFVYAGSSTRPTTQPLLIAGRKYTSYTLSPGIDNIREDLSPGTHLADTLYAYPFRVDQGFTLGALSVRTHSSHTATSAKLRVGIYKAASTGLPGSLLIESGELTMAATSTTYTAGSLAYPINLGWHWIAFCSNTPSASGCTLIATAQSFATTTVAGPQLGSTNETSGGAHLVTGSHAYAALPSTFPAVTYANSPIPICMWMTPA